MLSEGPMYCEYCKTVDTGVEWNSHTRKKEYCLNCGKEMVPAPHDTYHVVFGLCYGCIQTEFGIAPSPITLDDENFIVGSCCPNCHKVGLMKYTKNVDPRYRKYV